ncbi:regulator of telomere elongation helicase 1 homolog isoform X2 [Adelges cooleyi]|uniref:regulator of telomere elongation helicase 1 homolog isoform X2 n=1 Tax=Adelges cooleyi TaxID=133065 RepID=UPI00217F854C|nr:regulator of telomere elongation helicase 1 homolog isoform X2 [Adelges cooleyi]
MTLFECKGVLVDFPYEPYEVQKHYIEKVLECLQNGSNGVLESPTGTGKTLSLLCSSLGWLMAKKAAIQANRMGISEKNISMTVNMAAGIEKNPNSAWNGVMRPPRIIYGSRTHTQLNQVMKELRRTNYKHMKVGIIGSRDQLCIHPEVVKESNSSVKIALCRAKVSARTCHFYNNVEAKSKEAFIEDGICDIEDLINKGKKFNCCPYYGSRELQKDVDILFTPYNYIIDPKTRKAQDIQLSEDVIILDEGHNVEKMCEESCSVEITSTDIALCIDTVTDIMKLLYNEKNTEFSEEPIQLRPREFSDDDICTLKALFLEIEQAINNIELNSSTNDKKMEGSYIFKLLQSANITPEKMSTFITFLNAVIVYLSSSNSNSPQQAKEACLYKFQNFLECVLQSLGTNKDPKNTDKYFRTYIQLEQNKFKPKNDANKFKELKKGKSISFWCFSPGFGMRDLLDRNVHCIILTSGTLSPLAATITEIGIPVEVQLQNSHVIKDSQVCVSVVKTGPNNKPLICNYSSRNNNDFLISLGQTLVNFSRIIPGGTLVFFPSYPFLEQCVSHWQGCNIWASITKLKPIYVEPKNRDVLKNVIDEYYKAIQENKGAMLFAVYRGKVSEGLDFSDWKARAVIILGLPYPPYQDPRVVMKREYLDEIRKENKQCLSGQEWYKLEAIKAVNQAMGRVIRHVADWGSIIFCDERYASQYIKSQLSAWLQPHIKIHEQFSSAYRANVQFFKNTGLTMPSSILFSKAAFDEPAQATVIRSIESVKRKELENDTLKLYESYHTENENVIKKELKTSGKSLLESVDNYVEQKIINTVAESQCLKMDINCEARPLAKKRKLKIIPNKIEVVKKEDAKNKTINFMSKVRSVLKDSTVYSRFVSIVKKYMTEKNCDDFIKNLEELFPNKNPDVIGILDDLKDFLGKDVQNQFYNYCTELKKQR